jgi:hypothetical protein
MPGVFRVNFRADGMNAALGNTVADLARAKAPIVKAHTFLATVLQKRQAAALERSIAGHGRSQRHSDWEHSPIHQAIISKDNREVTVNGFTVGFLDDTGRFPDVGLYAAGLEGGTSVHRGARLRGYFVTAYGELVTAQEGQLDARFAGSVNNASRGANGRRRNSQASGFLIKRPIVGYRFQKAGYEQWKSDGYAGVDAVEAYADFMDEAGLRYAARLFRPGVHVTRR